MEYDPASRSSARERFGVAQIACYAFDIKIGNGARRANKRADPVAAFDEEAGNVPAHESRCAGDERWFHLNLLC